MVFNVSARKEKMALHAFDIVLNCLLTLLMNIARSYRENDIFPLFFQMMSDRLIS